jgi:hypothetical protein
MRWLPPLLLLPLVAVFVVGRPQRPAHAQSASPAVYGYSGWATYYGIEDGFVRGDVMYDGTPYDPGDPTIAASSFLIPLHTWLRVCQPAQCIVVQVRDRGLLDENSVLLDLSRAAYALLFGGLGGKQWVSAYYSDPVTLGVDGAPYITAPIATTLVALPPPAAPPPALATLPLQPSATPSPTVAPTFTPTPRPVTPTPTPSPTPQPNTIRVPSTPGRPP